MEVDVSDMNTSYKPYVSVIIAVYNVEKYIAQCCHSLFSQTLGEMEYIFINDRSPDNSIDIVKAILKEYPHRANQVKIIEHSVNLGVSRTREEGVRAATGDYVIHCDPDDWVEPDMYEQMYNKAISEDADFVMCDVFYHYPSSAKSYYGKETPKRMSCRSILASCLHAQHPILHCWLWNKLIRSDYCKNIEWHQGISLYEDLIACTQILRQPIKVGYINRAFYYYRQRENTLSHRTFTRQDAENDYEVISILHHHLCESGDPELYHYWQASVAWFMAFSFHASDKIYTNKEYLARYKKYRSCILKDRGLAKIVRIYLYCTTFNYVIPFTILQIYRKVRKFIKSEDR